MFGLEHTYYNLNRLGKLTDVLRRVLALYRELRGGVGRRLPQLDGRLDGTAGGAERDLNALRGAGRERPRLEAVALLYG